MAERNVQEFHVIPLFYDANKADPEILSKETMFQGLKRAHEYSGIGQISNALTKLWNRNEPDRDAAAWLCYYNNLVIDGAKTGKVNSYEKYPAVNSRINKATGGKTGRMPHFFQFSKNGRRFEEASKKDQKKYSKPNASIMNRLCALFDDIGRIDLNYAGIPPFNWQMLLPAEHAYVEQEAVQLFCQLDDSNISNLTTAKLVLEQKDHEAALGYAMLRDLIVYELNTRYGDYRAAYAAIVKHLFTGENLDKISHKQMFWRVYGDMAVQTLKDNLSHCFMCPACNQQIPAWVDQHICPKQMRGFFACVDCGSLCDRKGPRQCRCEECQTKYRRLNKLANKRLHYQRKR